MRACTRVLIFLCIFQVDYYGIADTLYLLLNGERMTIVPDPQVVYNYLYTIYISTHTYIFSYATRNVRYFNVCWCAP